MSNIIIGKHTLESLTTGMYADPYVVFREYIQNAVDAIDEAVRQNLLLENEGEITICLSPAERSIVISDNGAGIRSDEAEQTLISIGNSKKTSEQERGFRGIGRLAALGYCSKLTFETSAVMENVGTRIVIDSGKLSRLLSAKDDRDMTVTDVLGQVYLVEQYPESSLSHYFRVVLDGVNDTSGLNDYENVISYISQNAPVPYDPSAFTWGKEIIRRLKAEGLNVNSYNISVSLGNKTTLVYKPYKDCFLVDKGKNLFDSIRDIEIIHIQQNDGCVLAIAWLGKTNYLGSIYDKSIKGIRLRKGNIQIGDGQTLNTVFKDARFNGWSIGEVFVSTALLIPNARRDNFEKTPAYFVFTEQLQKAAVEITREIRATSLKRNRELSETLERVESTVQDAIDAIENGANITAKSRISQKLSSAQKAVSNSLVADESGAYYQEIAFDELDMLIGTLKGTTAFKAINALKTLNKTEKKILEHVFSVIVDQLGSEADSLIDALIDDFAGSAEAHNLERSENSGITV